ncbi:hypothetical protein D9M72_213240 [compost metagenome]
MTTRATPLREATRAEFSSAAFSSCAAACCTLSSGVALAFLSRRMAWPSFCAATGSESSSCEALPESE